jgi:hypothetical protein
MECLTQFQKPLINTFHNKDQGNNLEEHQKALKKVSNVMDSDNRTKPSQVSTQPNDISIREPVGTELM